MPPGATTAVIRFSSLGDVLLAAHAPSFLRKTAPGRRVLFVTKERYAEALRGHPHIDRFYALADDSSDPSAPAPLGMRARLGDLIAAMKLEDVEVLVDLHQNFRSSRILNAFPSAKRVLPPKHSLRRRMMVHARWLKPEPLPPLLESYREVCGLPKDAPLHPWLREALSPRELTLGKSLLDTEDISRGVVLLGAGARWETKRWPARHFVALGTSIERDLGLAVRYIAAPGECAAGEIRALLPEARRETLLTVPFRVLAGLAAHAAVIVSNDSAILHLGPALGIPAVGIFGSTVPGFGFARQGSCDEAVEIDLGCRPCDVHGKSRCPLRHHGCMERLLPDIVLAAIERALGKSIETERAVRT